MPLNPKIENWQDRTVWLVGASTGIGRATAQALHAQGARVVVSARSAPALQAFVQSHPGSQARSVDVTDAASLREAANEVVQAHGSLDLVLFCAGVYEPMRATDFNLQKALWHQQEIGRAHV